jgi:hypothetical protein
MLPPARQRRTYLDELNEGDEKTPWMGSIHNQSLQQHPCDLLLYNFLRKCMRDSAVYQIFHMLYIAKSRTKQLLNHEQLLYGQISNTGKYSQGKQTGNFQTQATVMY